MDSEDDTIGDLKKLVAAHAGTRCAQTVHTGGECPNCRLTNKSRLPGTRPEKIRIQKWCVVAVRAYLSFAIACETEHAHCRYNVFKDHITLEDYEIHDGMGLELYCALRAIVLMLCRGVMRSLPP